MSIVKITSSKLVQEIISLGSTNVSQELTDDLIKEMLNDVDIKSAWELMEESITSREWTITTDKTEYIEKASEIQTRFNNINMSKILKDMLKSTMNKKSIFEISFENMAISDLILLPNKYIRYDKNVGWKIKTRDNEIILDNEPNRFLICVNNESLENMQGESDLEPLVKIYNAKQNLENKLNAIIEKYGDIITVFAYEPPLETSSIEEKEARYKSVEEQAKQLKNAKGKDILAVPTSGDKSLKDFVEFIKLDDLKPEIYSQLQAEKEKAIQKYILGSTLVSGVDGNSGNRALGEIHNIQKELKINAKIKKIRDWFQKIIEIDATLYGYDSRNFYFKFVEELDEKEELELEEKKAEILSKKMDFITKLVSSGYMLSKGKIAEILGLDEENLIEANISIDNNIKSSEMLNFEFSKKDKFYTKRKIIEKNMLDFENYINTTYEKWYNKVIKAIKEALSKVKTIDDLFNMKYDYDNYLEEMLIKSELIAYDNELSIDTLEFNDNTENFLNKTKNSALEYFLKKYPALYEDIEKTIDYSRDKYFWMKKLTDINITEKFLNSLTRNLEKGETFKDWIKDSENIIDEAGLKNKEGYLKTVYRTNMNQSYNAGTYKKQLKFKDTWPYFKYCGTLDGREQEHTRKLDGKIFEIGTPAANLYYPPNRYNCRCYTVSLTEEDVNGEKIEKNEVDDIKLKDFKGNVGDKEYIRKLEEKYQIKAKYFNSKKGRSSLLNNAYFDRKGKYKNALDIDNIYDILGLEDITYKEHRAILDYSGDYYTDINRVLFSKDGNINNELQEKIDLISSGINKNEIKENIQVFRGVSGQYAEDLKINAEKMVGKYVPNDSFMSTSLSFEVAENFAKKEGVVFNLKVKKGKKAFFLSQQDAYYSPELEILFDKKTLIKIEKVYEKGKLTIIEGEVF